MGPFSFGFHVDDYREAGRRRLVWQLASGRAKSLFRENWGYWQVEPHGRGTMLTSSSAARTVLPVFLTRGAKREGLVDTINAVRDRAEGRGDARQVPLRLWPFPEREPVPPRGVGRPGF